MHAVHGPLIHVMHVFMGVCTVYASMVFLLSDCKSLHEYISVCLLHCKGVLAILCHYNVSPVYTSIHNL